MATGWTVGGIGWYRKTFPKPDLPPDGKAELRFEGVYMNSDVWINGVHLGNHPYGYTEFAYDITPHLKDGQNIVAVQVKNTGKNSRWYSGSGIFRKVWLNTSGRSPHSRARRLGHHASGLRDPRAVVNLEVTVETAACQPPSASPSAPPCLTPPEPSPPKPSHLVARCRPAPAPSTCRIRLANPQALVAGRSPTSTAPKSSSRPTSKIAAPSPSPYRHPQSRNRRRQRPPHQRRTSQAPRRLRPSRQRPARLRLHSPRRRAPRRDPQGQRLQRHPHQPQSALARVPRRLRPPRHAGHRRGLRLLGEPATRIPTTTTSISRTGGSATSPA